MKYVDILTTAADTKDNIVTFASGDEANPSVWKDVTTLASKEKHLSLLNKISTMFSNVRYLYKILGTTDISALGTVTQAIATLNGNVGSIKGISSSAAITTQGQYALDAREKNASIDGTLANELSKVNSNLTNKVDATTDMYSLLYRKNISTWTDKSQVSGMTGLYYIGEIDNTLWNEINRSDLTNVGDYILVLIGTNGNAEGGAAYATGFMVSPRWDTNFGYFIVWNNDYHIYKVTASYLS